MTVPVIPPVIASLGTPPNTADPDNFDARGDALFGQLPTTVNQMNAANAATYQNAVLAVEVLSDCNDVLVSTQQSASEAAASAAAAALSTNVTKWAAGTFVEGQCVWSPVDYQNYRCINAGVRNTDPSSDVANWRKINYEQPWRVVSGSVNAIPGDKLMFDTRIAQGELILPASPIAGVSRIDIVDYGNTFGTNKLIINGNGNKIEFLAENSAASKMGFNFGLVYVDATVGWKRV